MTHPAYIREKAVELRRRGLTLDEVAERLALPKTTVYSWIRGIPIERTARQSAARAAASERNRASAAAKREAAAAAGRAEFPELMQLPTFVDFVCMYIGEGLKRNRNRVALGNSDPQVVLLAVRWMRRLSPRKASYWLQYHADQDLEELRRFWASLLEVEPAEIRLQRKSNSGSLKGRSWRSQHGVLTVLVDDTQFRARLGAWMDLVKERWLDSIDAGRGAAW